MPTRLAAGRAPGRGPSSTGTVGKQLWHLNHVCECLRRSGSVCLLACLRSTIGGWVVVNGLAIGP
jgi:hypothetical protein